MSAFEGSYKSQLQGVSQQVARERLDGQVTAQDNMLSDSVTNLRRRPGVEFKGNYAIAGATSNSMMGWNTDIGGTKINVLLNINTGILYFIDPNYAFTQSLDTGGYLAAADRSNIQVTTVGSQFVMGNLARTPVLGAPITGQSTTQRGFFFIRTGAFDFEYNVTVTSSAGTTTATFRTPPNDGIVRTPTNVEQSSPSYICLQLSNQLNAGGLIGAVPTGAYCYMDTFGVGSHGTNVTVTSSLNSIYVQGSGNSYIEEPKDLPAYLSDFADGYVIATTSLRVPVYFQYSKTRRAWLECGIAGSPGSLINMPIIVQRNSAGTAWEMDLAAYEGRYAGDDISNPTPNFVGSPMTGLGSFQGRLVILCGSMVNMSGSGRLHRWFRSTLTEVVDSDPIQVGSSANSSAAYRYCVPFNKDLILFSEKYQALIPAGNQVVTPRNATVVITSQYDGDMTAGPIPMGRTLMYPAPRSQDFYGVLEMVPSQYTDSQFVSSDVTAHIPKYMPGRCRWAVNSAVANLALFGSTNDKFSATVHEYLWSGSDKVQQAWHKWTFPYEVADAFFSGWTINLIFAQNNVVIIGAIDPRVGTLTDDASRRPFLDLYVPQTVVNSVVTVSAALRGLDSNVAQKMMLSSRQGMMAGELVGVEPPAVGALTLTTHGNGFINGSVYQGIGYRSSFSPTPPMVKDANGVLISSNKLTLNRFMIGTANSGEFKVLVRDSTSPADNVGLDLPTLYWTSLELDLGHARLNTEGTTLLPCRTNASTTSMVMYTDSVSEMNLISLEYTCRYNQKLKRR